MKKILSFLLILSFVLILVGCEHTHAYGEWVVVKEATELEEGLKERVCSCGEKETETIEKLEHTHVFDEWVVVKEATETEEGTKERTCSCGEKETETIEKLEHTHVFGEWVVVKEATETEEGSKERECACGEKETETIAKLEHVHEFGEWVVVKEATDLEEGSKERECACGEKETETIAKLEHVHAFGEWVVVKEATEKEAGLKERECACGEKESEEIAKLDHVHAFGEWVVVKEATDFEEGLKERTCSCGEKETELIEKLSHTHNFGEWVVVKEATEEEVGLKERECVCGEKESEEIAKLEHVHNFVNGECSCGEKEQVDETFQINFELNGGSFEWSTETVSNPAGGIDSISNLPEVFMADFYAYLLENDLFKSSKVSTKLQVTTWAGFSAKYGDPVAWYNATSTGGYSAADGYSELFFDSVNGYEAVGGFLGTSPYKEKYANVTKHAIQLTTARYSIETSSAQFKGALGFVLDGYFYGTQGLLASSKPNYETFNALREVIPTPSVGYVGSSQTTNEYLVSTGKVGTEVKLVAPVKEGHMFLGWYTNPECTGEKVTTVSNGCTLYASWYNLNGPAPTHKINYVLNGGTNSSDAPTEFAFSEGCLLTKPTREGYIFVGWSTDEEGENLITEISKLVNSDVTLYANWVEGADVVYTITYVYTEGNLPTKTPSNVNEVIEYVLTSYYNWLKPNDSYESFKTKVTNDWKTNQNQNTYKFYKQGGKDTIDANYFVNAPENFDEWNAWFTVFDAQVTAANGAQNAWNSYVGILRLGQWLANTPPVTWKDAMNQALINATQIKIPLVTEYKPGDEFSLSNLTIEDGRTFLGWYDQNGNKVEKITASTQGNLVLTAKWSESTPVESFTVSNPITKLLKLSEHQLRWVIGPSNATYKKVTFASSNTKVLTVSDSGLIKGVTTGKAKVLITVHGNTSLNMELEIEVYVDPHIQGEFKDNSYVEVEEEIELKATLVGGTNQLAWKSNTPEIATVENGVVTGVKEGLAEIVVYCVDNENVKFTFYVTVVEANASGVLKLLLESNNKEVYTKNNLLIGIKIGSDGAYYSDIVGSVSKLLFEDYVVHDDYYLSNPTNKSTLASGGIQFITVHYAADMPYSSSAMYNGGKNLASYNKSCNTNGTQASWHYSTGNDGIWACQNEAYGAWHAGASKAMTWTDSGLSTGQVGTDLYTTDVTLGSDGYFYIKGIKTTVKNTSSGTKLNGMGLAVKVEGTKVFLGGHYYNSSYGYISSTGGNNNSIGMETSVREGSDLWLTWQYTAQLCAKLLIKYNLPLNRLVGHHFYSGKWCPQPMLENDLEIWYEFVELTRQQMEYYNNYSQYDLSFASSSEYLKDNGRVKKLPNYTECVTYTVTYKDGSTTKSVTLSSILPGTLE